MHDRNVWARGLTANDRGKTISVDGKHFLLRNAEHYDGRTVLTVVCAIEVPHDAEVTLHE